jgi:DNA relaxase NicK
MAQIWSLGPAETLLGCGAGNTVVWKKAQLKDGNMVHVDFNTQHLVSNDPAMQRAPQLLDEILSFGQQPGSSLIQGTSKGWTLFPQ